MNDDLLLQIRRAVKSPFPSNFRGSINAARLTPNLIFRVFRHGYFDTPFSRSTSFTDLHEASVQHLHLRVVQVSVAESFRSPFKANWDHSVCIYPLFSTGNWISVVVSSSFRLSRLM